MYKAISTIRFEKPVSLSYQDKTLAVVLPTTIVVLASTIDEYLFPFEFASILFLSAMIGAVLLTKKDKAQTA